MRLTLLLLFPFVLSAQSFVSAVSVNDYNSPTVVVEAGVADKNSDFETFLCLGVGVSAGNEPHLQARIGGVIGTRIHLSGLTQLNYGRSDYRVAVGYSMWDRLTASILIGTSYGFEVRYDWVKARISKGSKIF